MCGMEKYAAENWQELGRWVQRSRLGAGISDVKEWAELVGRSTRQLQGLERGEPVGSKTLELVAAKLGSDLPDLYEILNGGPGAARADPQVGVDPSESIIQRLTREADDAQAAFERAADALVAAEFAIDAANHRLFRHLAMLDKLIELKSDREKQLGRTLTNRELYALDGVDRPTASDLANYSVGYASNDPHERTRYEIALMTHIDGWDYEDAIAGSRFLEMTMARERAVRLAEQIEQEGGDDDGTQEPSQKTQVEARRGQWVAETSDVDGSLPVAADDVNPSVDEEPGGSES